MNTIKLNDLVKSIVNVESIGSEQIVLHVKAKTENYLVVSDFEKFKVESKEKFNLIVPYFTNKGWVEFLSDLKERAVKGAITEDDYTKRTLKTYFAI